MLGLAALGNSKVVFPPEIASLNTRQDKNGSPFVILTLIRSYKK